MDGDADAFSGIADGLDYPMIVVTAHDGSGPSGCLVGFWTQCSIEPTRLLVCVSRANHTHEVALEADRLGLHFLASDERSLAELFGSETGDEVDKFSRCTWHPGPAGVPVIEGCRRWVTAAVLDRLPLGDHTGLLVEPEKGRCPPWPGQLSFSRARDIDPGHPAG